MKLIWKFNLILLLVLELGLGVTAYIAHKLLHENAREEILGNARLMMEMAIASRNYTNTQIKPLLDTQLKYAFLPQSVPAYGATEQFNEVRKKYTDYNYKEATLNPTNPRDRATDWEADIVNQFRNTPERPEMMGVRDTPSGPSLYLARPLQIKNPACLACHTTPEAAPKTMIDLYGPANGFGWKLNEVVGAQIVSVPMSVPIERANQTLKTFMITLAGVALAGFIVLNLLLYYLVIRRIKGLSTVADQVSLGNLDAGEFTSKSRDEIGVLTNALARMKASLVQAMKMLEA